MLTEIIIVLVLVLLFFILFKVIKKVLKALLAVLALAIVLFIILGFFIMQDLNDMRQNFPIKESTFMLHNEGAFLVGASFKFQGMLQNKSEKSSFMAMTQEELQQFSTHFKNKEYDVLLGEKYKIVLIELSYFDETLPDDYLIIFGEKDTISEITFDVPIDKGLLFDILKSEDPLIEYIKADPDNPLNTADPVLGELGRDYGLDDELQMQFKVMVFFMAFKDAMGEGGTSMFIKGIKNEEIMVYPEGFLFKMVKYVPDGLLAQSVG